MHESAYYVILIWASFTFIKQKLYKKSADISTIKITVKNEVKWVCDKATVFYLGESDRAWAPF